MIAVRVADEDMCDRPAGDSANKRVEMFVVLRPRIDDRQFTFADKIGVRAMEGEGARVVRGHAGDTRKDRHRLAIGRLEAEVERQGHRRSC
jgi:hypothetical protein